MLFEKLSCFGLSSIGGTPENVEGLPPPATIIYWTLIVLSIMTSLRASLLSSVVWTLDVSRLPKGLFWTTLFAYGAFLVPLVYLPNPDGHILPRVTVNCGGKAPFSGKLLEHKDGYWHILVARQRMIVSIPDRQSDRVVMSQPTGQTCL